MSAVLTVAGADVSYGELHVVRGLAFEAHAGRTVAIVGRNGAGKSSTLLAVAGVVRASFMTLRLGDRDLRAASPAARAHAGIQLVPEGKRVFRSLTVQENIRLGSLNAQVPRPERADALEAIFARFPTLGSRRTESAGNLSGGQQQLLALAQAIVARPRVLLVDEPSSGLAPVVVDEILAVIDELKREGIAVVLVEQLVDRVHAIADDLVLVERGRVVETGPASDIDIERVERIFVQ